MKVSLSLSIFEFGILLNQQSVSSVERSEENHQQGDIDLFHQIHRMSIKKRRNEKNWTIFIIIEPRVSYLPFLSVLFQFVWKLLDE